MIKTRYLVFALAALFLVMTFLSFYFYWQENGALLTKETEQARFAGAEFAKTHNQQACLDTVIERSQTCRDTNCTVELKNFLTTCFEQAEKSPAVCDQVPAPADYINKVSWTVSKCRKAKIRNGNCTNIINEMPLLCEQEMRF
ncbi:hypothetical protein N7931_10690 [Catenovulum sp. 2E275]|uniref:hypothetical protein n=1 Tax=Catenovulum sp. 2E275 TaxID=2980497 RepID=UPI0021CED22D|nr:hypothetical protein [Catenovulum sp. 2E275]MCU4676101.1 hypothetical protein [Catenovulum sp. 2E275]